MSVVFSIYGFIAFLVTKKIKHPEFLPAAVIYSLMVILYLAGLVGILGPVSQGVYILGFLLFAYSLFDLWQQNRLVELTKPWFWVIGAMYVLIGSIIKNYAILGWDEFSHWGLIFKDILATDALSNWSHVRSLDYPPGAGLMQYYFAKNTGVSNEGVAFLGQLASLLIPLSFLFGSLHWKDISRILIGVLAIHIALKQFSMGYHSLYVDHLLTTAFATLISGVFILRKGKTSQLWLLAPTVGGIVLLKISGIFFVTLFVLILLISWLTKKEHRNWNLIISITLIVTFCYSLKWSWEWHKPNVLVKTEKAVVVSTGTPKKLTQVVSQPVKPEGRVNNMDTFNKRAKYLFPRFIKKVGEEFIIRGGWISFIFVLAWMLSHREQRRHLLLFYLLTLVGFVLYSTGLFVLYTKIFNIHEGNRMASFGRYLGSYLNAWIICSMAVFLSTKSFLAKTRIKESIALVLFIFILSGGLDGLRINLKNVSSFLIKDFEHSLTPLEKKQYQTRKRIAIAAKKVKEYVPTDSKIYIIYQNSTGYIHRMIKYELVPLQGSDSCYSIGNKYGGYDNWTCPLSKKKWSNRLRTFDYLFLGRHDENFWRFYTSMIKLGPKLGTKGNPLFLFKITDKNREFVSLEPIESLLLESSLEAGAIAEWLERDSTAVTSVTTDPQTGTYHLKVANTAGNTRPCAYIKPTLVVGNIYKVIGWIQGVTAGGSNGSAGLININYGGQEDWNVGHTLTADTWVKFEMEFKALETSPEIWFTTAGNEGDGDYIYVDNVSIYEILQPEDQAAKRMWLQYLL